MDRTSGKPSPSESLLSKRKAAILERSMAVLEQHLDKLLSKRKRACEDSDSDGEDNNTSSSSTRHPAVVKRSGSSKAAQKRTKREPTHQRRFACPFAKHNPSKFKNVKTCCGPGWTGVHRVKEHLYRCHQLKNTCNRCAESFDDAKGLKEHQRAATPCQLKDDAPSDIITEDQEKLLHARAKPGSSPEDNWRDMYRILFPDAEDIPSPFYDTDPETAPANLDEAPRFRDMEEFNAHFKQEFLKAVKPMLVVEVEKEMQAAEANVVKKVVDFASVFHSKYFRALDYQAEQAGLVLTPAETEAETEAETGEVAGRAPQVFSAGFEPLPVEDISSMCTGLMSPEGGFNWNFMGPSFLDGVDCVDGVSAGDSGYMTSSVDGGIGGSWGY